jgi:hypothetical protein
LRRPTFLEGIFGLTHIHIRKCHTENRTIPHIKLPTKDTLIWFDINNKRRIQQCRRKRFIVYADFEATNIKTTSDNITTIKQIPNSYCLLCPDLYDVGVKNQYIKIFMHNDPNVLMQQFIKDIDAISGSIKHRQSANMVMSNDDRLQYDAATECENCGVEFGVVDDNGKCVYKVRHHDHLTGKYIGAWCSRCNFLEGENNFELRIVFHNLKGYDSHHIIRYALKYINEGDYKTQFYCGKSSEQFNYIKVGKYIFMDS